jgi:hypothetical protein
MTASSVVLCCALGVVSMKADVPLGIVVAALVVLVASAMGRWLPGIVLAAAVILGVLAATSRRRRSGPDPEETIRPGGDERPWRH